MNPILQNDIKDFVASFAYAEMLNRKSFLITGATGLIGSTLVHCLLELDQSVTITILVRKKERATQLFGCNRENLILLEYDIDEFVNQTRRSYDYIIHCACPTSSCYMTEHPVETYEYILESTRLLLKFAYETKAKSFVYLSSVEYYGEIFDDNVPLNELQLGYINHQSVRSCYPMGKQAAEFLCLLYARGYGVPAKIARLTQSFGPEISAMDNRVYAQFARSIVNSTDIILHTKGESSKPYCYVIDSVSAIIYILLFGESGRAYNVANELTYISIKDLAFYLRDHFNPSISVRIEELPNNSYAPATKLRLSTSELRNLGWSPKYDMETMFENLIEGIRFSLKTVL